MLETVCTVGFYGFLRCGEFTVLTANKFDSSVNLCMEDIIFHKNLVVLKLKQSKQALEESISYVALNIKHVLGLCGFNPDNYNGHSLRIGAATSAGKVHLEDHLIKTLGRWSSDSYCRYVRVSPSSIKHAQNMLGRF